MTVQHTKTTVTTTAGSLKGGVVDNSVDSQSYTRTVVLTNTGAVDVFIGGPGVTSTSYGYKLAAGASKDLPLYRNDELFAITGSSTADVVVLHLGIS